MGEHSEHPERTANNSPEHLTFAEAGERLGITADAVRMRISRGELAAVEIDNRRLVLWPQPATDEQPNEQRTARTSSVRANVQESVQQVQEEERQDDRQIAALED